MKPKLSYLCLLLSASALSISPLVSQDAAEPVTPSEVDLAQERLRACQAVIESQILRPLNPEVRSHNRFSRVVRPMPEQYYAHHIVGENEDGMIEFQINHISRMVKEPVMVLVASGTFDTKTGEIFLKDDRSGKFVAVSEHPLFKKEPKS